MSTYKELQELLNKNEINKFNELYKISNLKETEDYTLIDFLFMNQKKNAQEILLLSKNKNKNNFIELMYITLNYLISKYITLSEKDILFIINNIKVVENEYKKIITEMFNKDNIHNPILTELIEKYRNNFNINEFINKLKENKKINKEQIEKINLYFEMLDF